MIPFRSKLKAALHSPLLPFWLVITLLPFGRSSELGTFLCLVGVILLFVREPRVLEEHGGARLLLWLLAAYVGAALISSIDSVVPGKSWGTVAALLRYAPLGLYACFAIRRESKLQMLYVAVAGVLALWTLDAWVQTVTGWSVAGRANAEHLSGIFGAENLKLGPTLAVLSPFALWTARKYGGLPGLLLSFVLMLGPVLLAGSRAAWLCYALVAIGFAWRESRSAWRFAAFCAGAVLLLAIAGGIAWKTSERFQQRIDRTMLALHGSSQSIDTAMTGRLDIWQASLKMIAAHPVNGVGVRGFRDAYPRYVARDDHFLVAEPCGVGEGACHAHQLVLEVLTETGVIGLLLWLAAAAFALRAWSKAGAQTRSRVFPVTLALGVMLFPVNTHLAFYSAWWGLLFGWLLGLWCAALYVQPDAELPPVHRTRGVVNAA
ncbi:O-antigen ligase family protein [Rhodanobacter sp. L36]|uniref:O-antigen ligase family protein n=1 Tax=Rhodanobacter sp. L36 TaxID=1747221 RepID=UPI00131D751B|nr:O-antigen ligase family protein [Rhodanobacter sp. L36]